MIPRLNIWGSILEIKTTLLFVFMLSMSSMAFQPNDPDFVGEWESLDQYRRRRGIEFNYQTTAIHPELCRFKDENECKQLDRQARKLQVKNQFTGNQKVLVILLKTTSFRTPPRADFDQLFNDRGRDDEITPTGSVYEYFRLNSYGKFIIDAYVHDWTDSAMSEAACAGDNQGVWEGFIDCVAPALNALEQKHQDSSDPFNWFEYDLNIDGYIDNLIIIHNGYPAESGGADPAGTPNSQRIRSHAGFTSGWRAAGSGYRAGYYAVASAFRGQQFEELARLNIITHEFIHTTGMIDLYDLDFIGNGCGGFCIMAYPVGQSNSGKRCGNVSAYTKAFLGWVTPIRITSDGTYDVEASFISENSIYKIDSGHPNGEYLLIENRQPLEWDISFWGGGGIVIWYVDETKTLNDSTQTRVAIVQADGDSDLEKRINLGDATDLWVAGGAKTELTDSGNPNTKSRRTGASTGYTLFDFSPSAMTMQFTVNGIEATISPRPTPQTEAPEPSTPVETASPTPKPEAPEPSAPVETASPTLRPEAPEPSAPVETASPTLRPEAPEPSTPTETASPTLKPEAPEPSAPVETTAPNEAPIDNTDACLVTVQVEECGPLLDQTELKPDCDCYNYCNGAFLDCCAYGEPCPLSCQGGSFVAGCVFKSPTASPTGSPTIAPTKSPVAPPTPAPTSKPTQMPSAKPTPDDSCQVLVGTDKCSRLMRNAEKTEDCDCYNFCNGEELACCQFDEPCPFLFCDGDFVAGCTEGPEIPSHSPSAAPTSERVCLASVQTAQCEDLTVTQTPIGSCDCYNYCNGQFIGCCAYGEFCGFECQGDLVAGCEIEDNEIEDRCLISVNIDECGPIVESQEPVSDCDCYDYCNGVFVGCCKFNEFCGLNCRGPDIVAGCTLDAVPAPNPNPVPTPDRNPVPAPETNPEPTPTPRQGGWPTFFWPEGLNTVIIRDVEEKKTPREL